MLSLPIYDLPTRSASGMIIRHVLPRSFPPQLVGPLSQKQLFAILTIGDVIIGVGHGSPSELTGHKDQVILDTESIPDVKGKIITLISCETAQVLGPALIDAGAASYIGFQKDLVWVCDADLASRPWRDKVAQTVMGPITDCVNAILDGRTVKEAFDAMLSDLSANAQVEEDELVRSCILFNKKNAVLLGNPEAKTRKRPPIFMPVGPPPLPPF